MEPTTVLAILAAVASGGVALYRKLSPHEQAKRKQEESNRRKNALRRQRSQWERVNASPWWMDGIPRKANLVLDFNILNDDSREKAFWFKMLQDHAKERDWNVVVMHAVYNRCLKNSGAEVAMARLDNLQTFLNRRFRVLPKPKGSDSLDEEMAKYLLAEKVRDDVFFTGSRKSKIALANIASQNGVELVHEVRTSKNFKVHESFDSICRGKPSGCDAYPDVSDGIDSYGPNAEFSLQEAGLCEEDAEDLCRFVERNIIKLNIVD